VTFTNGVARVLYFEPEFKSTDLELVPNMYSAYQPTIVNDITDSAGAVLDAYDYFMILHQPKFEGTIFTFDIDVARLTEGKKYVLKA